MAVQVRARKTVADQARTWVGTPFKHWGRTKGKEVDCAGLILGVGTELNIAPVPVIEGYGVSPHEEFVLSYCDKHLIAVDRKYPDFAMGDIVLFWGVDAGRGKHFAICHRMYDAPTMIHAFAKQGKVVEHHWGKFWPGRFVRAYEYPNLEPL